MTGRDYQQCSILASSGGQEGDVVEHERDQMEDILEGCTSIV